MTTRTSSSWICFDFRKTSLRSTCRSRKLKANSTGRKYFLAFNKFNAWSYDEQEVLGSHIEWEITHIPNLILGTKCVEEGGVESERYAGNKRLPAFESSSHLIILLINYNRYITYSWINLLNSIEWLMKRAACLISSVCESKRRRGRRAWRGVEGMELERWNFMNV